MQVLREKIEKVGFMVCFKGQLIIGDDNVMKCVNRKERPIYIDISVDFEEFVVKICYHLRIDRSQPNIHIFIPGEALIGLIKIQDNDDLKFVMMEARSLQESTKFCVTKSPFEERDNQQNEEVNEEKREDYPTYDLA